jgi:hypothetical protein
MQRLSRAAAVVAALTHLTAPRPAVAEPEAPTPPDRRVALAALEQRHGPPIYRGLVQLRANEQPGEEHLVGDNTDPAGMRWTKLTNLALDLLSALIAVERRLIPPLEAREHVRAVLDALSLVPTFKGIFPEVLLIEGGLRPERSDGRVRYSAVDAAWLTLSLSVLDAYYAVQDPELARRARALLDAQDYTPFIDPEGLLAGGIVVDEGSARVVGGYGFAYADRNSELRPLIVALASMGKLSVTTWSKLRYDWTAKEGLRVARSWHSSAFVELAGELLFDEMTLAPESLGLSHRNYLEATRRVARRSGHRVWGYAPTGDARGSYAEFGLDRPDVVSPYGAALLALAGDDAAVANLGAVLAALPTDGRPMPDGLDPRTGLAASRISRSLDQGLLFLALHAETLRDLARRTPWYSSAEGELRALDRTCRPPAVAPVAEPASPPGASSALWQTDPDGWQSRSFDPVPSEPVPSEHAPSRSPEAIERGHAALHAITQAARRAQTSEGGSIALATRRAQVDAAGAARGWLELVPDFTLVLRHESWHGVDGAWDRPAWWAEGEARAALSPYVIALGLAAERATELARLDVAQTERALVVESIGAELAREAAERRLAGLRRERSELDALRRGLSLAPRDAGGGTSLDTTLLDARLAVLDAEIAVAEGERKRALDTLFDITREPLPSSGLDLRLGLADARELIRRELREHPAADDERAEAGVAYEVARRRAIASRAAYVPELRARAFAALAHDRQPAGAAGWQLERVTGELSLAFAWHPETSALERARAAAVERSEQQRREVRASRAESCALARARAEARASAWSSRTRPSAAETLYAQRVERYRRGEIDVRAVLDSSRLRRGEAETSEQLLRETLAAELVAAAAENSENDCAAPLDRREPLELDSATSASCPKSVPGSPRPRCAGEGRGEPGQMGISAFGTASTSGETSRGLNSAMSREADRSAPVLAARAEARRARADADATATSYELGFEGGVLGPLYQRGDVGALSNGGSLVGSSGALGSQPVADASWVVRVSLETRLGDRASIAARAEADWLASKSELTRKRSLAETARARLVLAYAWLRQRLADRRARLATEHRAALMRMQSQGLLADPALAWQADLRLDAARELWARERGALREAQIALNARLGRALDTELALEEAPAELEAWLEATYYPEHRLSGYEGELVPAIAELELRSAEAALEALRHPPAAVGILLQASHSLETSASMLGFGIGFNLDAPTRPARTLAAAEAVGRLRGGRAAARHAIAREREKARAAYEAASAVHALAAAHRERMLGLLSELLTAQAADLDQHESSKLRARAELGERVLDADTRELTARQALGLARLRRIELGERSSASPRVASEQELERVEDQLAASAPTRWPAEAAARAVSGEPLGPPLIAGLRVAGPALGVASLDRPTGGSGADSARDLQATLGAGIRVSLAEGLGFATRGRLEAAARLDHAAAREDAELEAISVIGARWHARERRRLLAREEASAKQRLEAIVLPRYRAAHIGVAPLADAQSQHSATLAALRRAEIDEQSAIDEIASRGVAPDDRALDAYARCNIAELEAPLAAANGDLEARLEHLTERQLRTRPGLLALDQRRQAANDETWLSLLGVLGPATLFIELAPRGHSDGLAGARESTWDRRHAWLTSLILPVTPKLIGDSVQASREAKLRSSERDALERALESALQAERLSVETGLVTWNAARRRRDVAALTLDEVADRYRTGTARTTIEHLLNARDDLFLAEHAELDAHAPWLEACRRLRVLER